MNISSCSIGAAAIAVAALLLYGCRRNPTPEERLASFAKVAESQGNQVFRTIVEGRPLALLLARCKVYRLEATSEGVTQHEVLRTGFVLWFVGCMRQKAWREGEYVLVELVNQAFGAGGGNASGGTYRSKNGVDWEKHTRKGWLPVAEAQQ